MTPRLLHGDALEVLGRLRAEGRFFALSYVDPPFNTGRRFRTRDGRVAFSDQFRDADDYVELLWCLAASVRPLLAPHGSIVMHLDPRWAARARVHALDPVFGADAFRTEIVWRYRRWPSPSGDLQRVHDVLVRYVRDPSATARFRVLHDALAPSTVATWGTGRQKAVVGDDGRRKRSSTTEEASPGVPMGDVWEIPIVAPVARERKLAGSYPTQKPEALLRRVIECYSDPGDLVLDPMCGSGTTLAAAAALGRGSVGIDRSDVACEVAARRLGVDVERAEPSEAAS